MIHFIYRGRKTCSAIKKYEHNFMQNAVLLFMSLLTTLIVKNSTFLLEFTISFKKNILDQTWKAFNTKSGPQ